MITVCITCETSAAVGPENGYFGLPSLDPAPRGRGRHRLSTKLSLGTDAETDETFGCLYSGVLALGVTTHALETYRHFLELHGGRGHRLREWVDDFEDAPTKRPPRFEKYRSPKRKGPFIYSRLTIDCPKCEETFESDDPDWAKPIRPRALQALQIDRFLTRAGEPSEFNVFEAWPFGILLFDRLTGWLRAHRTHRPLVRVTSVGQESYATRTKARRGEGMASEAAPAPAPTAPSALLAETLARLIGLNSRNTHARVQAATALGKAGEPATAAFLLAALDDLEPSVRKTALEALSSFPNECDRTALGIAWLDEDEEIRVRASEIAAARGESIQSLGALALAPRPRESVGYRSLGEQAAVAHPDRWQRLENVHRYGPVLGDELILALLEDRFDEVVVNAGLFAARRQLPRAAEALCAALPEADGPVAATLMQAIRELLAIGGAGAIASLQLVVRTRQGEIRREALRALVSSAGADALPWMIDLLADPDLQCRVMVAETLLASGYQSALLALVDVAAGGDAHVAAAVYRFLVSHGDVRTLPALVAALDVVERHQRDEMAAAYLRCGHETLARVGRGVLGRRRPVAPSAPLLWGLSYNRVGD